MFKCVVPKPGRRRSFGRQARHSNKSSPEKTGNQKNSVKVVVRVRPENEKETQSANNRNVVHVIDTKMLIFDPVEETDAFFYHGQKQAFRDLMKKQNKDLKFMFDHIFSGTSDNAAVFEHTTRDLLDTLLSGFNCSVFAYGATGSGKTYTMLGSPSKPGIIFMTMMELYKKIDELKDQKDIHVSVSYLEVYNETILDLLTPSSGLQVREDSKRGVVVSGLSSHVPKDANELLNMIHFGNGNRTQHPTDANAESSRSHAIFQVYVRQKDRTSGLSSNVRLAKMSLIDLAGSERASAVSKCNERFREGANINKSLLALGNCINALADKKHKNHIPYRNSKLTHILKDSLGGNCYTVMISTVSPSSLSYEDTYNTLKYADRAKTIQLSVKRNIQSIDAHISNYAKIVEKLQKENAELKAKLQMCEEMEKEEASLCTCGQSSAVPVITVAPSVGEVEKIEELFTKNKQLRTNILEHESSIRQLEIQIHLRKSQLEHFLAINQQEVSLQKSTAKTDQAVKALEDRCQTLITRKQELIALLENNIKDIDDLKERMLSSYEGTPLKLLEGLIRKGELETERAEVQIHMDHIHSACVALEKEHITTERLLLNSLNLNRAQQIILGENELLTDDIKEGFSNLIKHSQHHKEVTWADKTPPPVPVNYQHFLQLPLSAMAVTKTSSSVNMDCNGPSIETGYKETQPASTIKASPRCRGGVLPPLSLSSDNVRRSLNNLFLSVNTAPPLMQGAAKDCLGVELPLVHCQGLEQNKSFPISPCYAEPVANTSERVLNRTFWTTELNLGDTLGRSPYSPAAKRTALEAFMDLTVPKLGLCRTPTPPRPRNDYPKCLLTVNSSPELPKVLGRSTSSNPELPTVSSFHTRSPAQGLHSTGSPDTNEWEKQSLNTSYTIESGSDNTCQPVPISCDDVTSTTFANKEFSPADKVNITDKKPFGDKFSRFDSTFRVLTPQNGVKKSNTVAGENTFRKYSIRSSFHSYTSTKGSNSSKSYMSMTTAASGKVRAGRRLSVVKENVAPYLLAKYANRAGRTAFSVTGQTRARWSAAKKCNDNR